MAITIVLIGKTNVGKSTLFNKLIKKNFALTNNCEHFTRDRKYGKLIINNISIDLIDTAGIEIYNKKNILKKKIIDQTYQAIYEADLILFIVNICDNINYEDIIFIKLIRKKLKKIFLVINKIDNIKNSFYKLHEFYSLGIKNIFYISALKNIGIDGLIKKIKIWVKNNFNNINIMSDISINNKNSFFQSKIKKKNIISIVGKPNVGKSTLFNSLLKKNHVITHNLPGTTRDSILHEIVFLNKKYTIIDTAGLDKKKNNKIQCLSMMQTLHAINIANVIILLIDSQQGISQQDIWILNTLISSGKFLLILFNKSEQLSLKEQKKIRNQLLSKNSILKFFNIAFISALYNKGINKIFSLIKMIFHYSNTIMKSSQLTKILYYAIHQHPPENVKGKTVKLKYAHPGGYFPPIIIIHGSKISLLSDSYKRYLLHYFQKYLNIKNIGVKIIFKNIKNPYVKL